MKKCTNCGAELQDAAAFCTQCGAKAETAEGARAENAGGAKAENAGGAYAGYTSANQSAYGTGGNQQGSQFGPQSGPKQGPQPGAAYYAPPIDIYDHTAEFEPKDIADNKVIAMLAYLMGTVGVIIALLAAQSSKYAAFHVRQALKFTVIEILVGIVTVLLVWTILVPIAGGIFLIILFVVRIICFFSICKGQAKEPPIIRSFGFLR